MARLVAAFGTSHSTMLFSSVENWQALFDHVDCKAPVNDFEGTPRSFDDLLKATPPGAAARISKEAIAERHRATTAAMDRLNADIAQARLDALIVIGDDQREIFQDACRPAIGVYYGDTIRTLPRRAHRRTTGTCRTSAGGWRRDTTGSTRAIPPSASTSSRD